MEPGGRNQWQPVANAARPKTLQQGKTVAMGCYRLPIGAHGKEAFDGSSPSEGFTKPPPKNPHLRAQIDLRLIACGVRVSSQDFLGLVDGLESVQHGRFVSSRQAGRGEW
jgi:hypothetical protein